jgi:replication factor A1
LQVFNVFDYRNVFKGVLFMKNMKISELTPRQGNVDVEGTIKEIEEPRSFNKFGRELKVANVVLEDDSGNVKLTLWNDDINKFVVGDKVKITNGYVSEFQGEKQLTSGKFGKIEKAGEGNADASTPADESGNEDSADAPVEDDNSGNESSSEKSEDDF